MSDCRLAEAIRRDLPTPSGRSGNEIAACLYRKIRSAPAWRVPVVLSDEERRARRVAKRTAILADLLEAG